MAKRGSNKSNKKKSKGKSRKRAAAASRRPRYKTGPKKGQFKPGGSRKRSSGSRKKASGTHKKAPAQKRAAHVGGGSGLAAMRGRKKLNSVVARLIAKGFDKDDAMKMAKEMQRREAGRAGRRGEKTAQAAANAQALSNLFANIAAAGRTTAALGQVS